MNWLTNTIGNAAGQIQYWFGGGAALQSKSDALKQQLNSLNSQDYAPGGQIYNAISNVNGPDVAAATWQQVQQNATKSDSAGSVKSQLEQAGQAGAAQGLNSLASNIQGFATGIWDTITKLMPWQAWLAIAAGIFLYFGGLRWLKKQFA